MSLPTFIKDLGGKISKFDENFITWSGNDDIVLAMVIRVDDIFVCGQPQRRSWALA